MTRSASSRRRRSRSSVWAEGALTSRSSWRRNHCAGCDIVVGCVEGFRERWELQVLSRRYLVPLIDIGLDVNTVGDEPPRMAGQVILSVPRGPCMKCMHFITDQNLEKEAGRYGDAGVRPQVVWANGVLASVAVGVAVDLLERGAA